MSGALHDFGRAELVDAEAIGEPGHRRFRLFARSSYGTASLWLERQQMEALSRFPAAPSSAPKPRPTCRGRRARPPTSLSKRTWTSASRS